MYGQNHQQGHNVFVNGGQNHGRYGVQLNNAKPFQNAAQHANQTHRGQQDHSGQHANYVNHQQNASANAYTNGTPNFASHQLRNGTPGQSSNGNPESSAFLKAQIEGAHAARQAIGAHYHARNANLKGLTLGSSDSNKRETEREKEERHRTTHSAKTSAGQHWNQLDLGGQGIRAIAPQLLNYSFLTVLHLNSNRLTYVPPEIGKLTSLQHLDLSLNNIQELPIEVGMLTNLQTLLLYDNQLESLPMELGYLFKLHTLGVEGNPLDDGMRSVLIENGTKSLIAELRERIELEPPNDRPLYSISEVKSKSAAAASETISVMSFNILNDRMATRNQYGYTPEGALSWDHRRSLILEELEARDADVICLQEVDQDSFDDQFRPTLAQKDYRGVFFPKVNARTMRPDEARKLDGCAILFKNDKFILLDKHWLDIQNAAMNRQDMKREEDLFNRVTNKYNMATVVFLEDRQSGCRIIVANTHLHWDPGFADVKIIQTALILEEVAKLAETWSRHPACKDKQVFRFSKAEDDSPKDQPVLELSPSQEYPTGTSIPLLICGDFNSTKESGVYDLLSNGTLAPDHPELKDYRYGTYTKEGMAHPFQLKSAYSSIGELLFTNYTPGFVGVLDYIWYSANSFQVLELLGDVDAEYLKRVPGFPNVHYPSDHLALMAKFAVKQKKDRQKPGEADGP